jgi:hypothetical protein
MGKSKTTSKVESSNGTSEKMEVMAPPSLMRMKIRRKN